MGSTEQYLRTHNVNVAVQSTDDTSFAAVLPNLLGLLVLLALLFILLRRSNLLGNPMGAMTKHLAEARTGDADQVTFSQVVGVDEAKHELEEVVEFLKAPSSFGKLGARMPRGILLVGPPGTGKTLLSRAVAGEAKVPYFSLSGSDFVEMFVGVGAARVRDLFRHAKKNAPCLVFLDEIDALGRRRGGAQIRTNEEREQTLNQLLVEMDGFNTDCAVVVIAGQELDEASLRVMAGPEKRSRMITPEEKSIIAYHEVGHALVMKSIAKSDPVHKVSVISRGQALGITIQLPLKDRYLTSKSELMARMAAAMGGRAAEEIIFGDVTTGAKQDIEQATSIARQMVCEFGMSERLGLVTLHRRGEGDSLFFSELTAADVDAEVKALTDAAYRQAYDICHTRRATLVRIAEHLQLVETIDGDELDRLLLEEAIEPAA